MYIRVWQPPHEFDNFSVTTFTLAQVGGFAQKHFWSSFVKICQCYGPHSDIKTFGNFKKKVFFILNISGL